MSNELVNLTISKEIINPIVEMKMKEAISQALGGSDAIVKKVIDEILYAKVAANGVKSTYERDNTFNWIDIVATNQIKEAVRKELINQISVSSEAIKDALVKNIQTNKGASLVATAIMNGLNETFKNSWTSNIAIEIKPTEKKY